VLNRAAIRKALDAGQLGASILPPAFQALVASDLADQVESLKLTLEPLDTEEMSRLWSAMQAHYRPTAAYCVSVVLIEATKPVHTALPVLSRGTVDPVTKRDRGVAVQPDMGPPLPTLLKSVPANDQVAAMLGELVRLDGVHLNGTGVAVDFGHALLSTPNTVVIGVNDDPKLLDVSLPSGSVAEKAWPAGVWTVTVRLTRPGETVERTTNAVAMLLAPSPVLSPAPTVVRDPASGRVRVTVKVRPEVRPTQTAQLSIGGDTATADPHPTPTGTLTFHFGVIPDGARPVRVAVDGVESRLVDRSTVPPRYDPTQKITVPA
jgi:hypothetical protein